MAVSDFKGHFVENVVDIGGSSALPGHTYYNHICTRPASGRAVGG